MVFVVNNNTYNVVYKIDNNISNSCHCRNTASDPRIIRGTT